MVAKVSMWNEAIRAHHVGWRLLAHATSHFSESGRCLHNNVATACSTSLRQRKIDEYQSRASNPVTFMSADGYRRLCVSFLLNVAPRSGLSGRDHVM